MARSAGLGLGVSEAPGRPLLGRPGTVICPFGANSPGGNWRLNRDLRSVAEQNAHPTSGPWGHKGRKGVDKLALRNLSPRPYANEVTFRSRLIGQAVEVVVEEPMGLRGCRPLLSYWRLQHAVAYSWYETYWPAALLETSGCQSREGRHALPAVGLPQRRGAQQAPKATWSSVSIVSLPVSRRCCSNTKGPSDTNGSSQSHSYGQKKSCDISLPLSSILISPSLCAAERLVHRLAPKVVRAVNRERSQGLREGGVIFKWV